MKNNIQITINSSDPSLNDQITEIFRVICKQEEIQLTLICFPSNGPLGHQIRVTTTNRIGFDRFTQQALALVDKMDYFFHQHKHEESAPKTDPALLLIIQQSSLLDPVHQSDLIRWNNEINAILPQSDYIFDCSLINQSQNNADNYSQFCFQESQTQINYSPKDLSQLIHKLKKGVKLNA